MGSMACKTSGEWTRHILPQEVHSIRFVPQLMHHGVKRWYEDASRVCCDRTLLSLGTIVSAVCVDASEALS